MEPDIALTDLGIVNALGNDPGTVWKRLFRDPEPGLTDYPGINDFPSVPTGVVEASLPEVPDRLSAFDCRNNRLARAALDGIEPTLRGAVESHGPDRVGVVVGTSTSGVGAAEDAVDHWLEEGSLPDSFDYRQMEMGGLAEFVRRYLNVTGPAYTVSTSCSSSAKVFASARALLRRDLCDAVVVGGADSLCGLTLNGFHALQLVSEEPCSPMSRHRDGINIGEGAAFFLMEPGSGPIRLAGVGESSDAHSMNAPDPEGRGAEISMHQALREAGREPDEVTYLNLHGTATPHNDAMESRAVERLFGTEVPCSSTKRFTGHLLGAAGAVEAAFCWLMLDHRSDDGIPLAPHRWDGERDESLPRLTLVGNDERHETSGPAVLMSNSFAFGGHNCSIVLEDSGRV